MKGPGLPNSHVLIRPFIRREAVLSSKIEGAQATVGKLLASEAGTEFERSLADLREVANFVVALEYGVRRLEKLPNRLENRGILKQTSESMRDRVFCAAKLLVIVEEPARLTPIEES